MKWIVRCLNRALWLDVENWLTGQLNTNSPSRYGLIIRSGLPRVERWRTWSTCSVWAWYEVGMECLSGFQVVCFTPGRPLRDARDGSRRSPNCHDATGRRRAD